MGWFKRKRQSSEKSPIVQVYENQKNFFDEDFREEIKDHARGYFDEVIKQNVVVFKQDLDKAAAEISAELKSHTIEHLDDTLASVTSELREHTMRQLDERFAVYGKEMKEAQEATLQSIDQSAKTLEGQYRDFSMIIQRSIANQGVMINGIFEENMNRLKVVKEEQTAALQILKDSVSLLEKQSHDIGETLQKNVAAQEETILTAFQGNMAQIVEHYLLGALGDQYDLKAQVPSIIKQMESTKDAMVDDMKL